jgi:4-amino-4-deoxy-L-arabinose transferase-like glycosyltransferase
MPPTPVSAWRRTNALAPIVFAIALAVAVAIVVGSIASAPHDARGDGEYYLQYMQQVHEHGLSVFPSLFDHWNGDAGSWNSPPPSRIGFIVVSTAGAALFGPTIDALQYLSIAAYLAGSVANYAFARRHFGEPRALFIAMLWMFSPLLMGLSRLPLSDTWNALCSTLTAWLFLELVDQPDSFRRRAAFMAMFAFAVLVKELSVLLVLPMAALVLVERCRGRAPLSLATFVILLALPGIVVVTLLAMAAGSLASLLETTRIVLASPAANRYAVNFGSGPWFSYVVDFLCLSPGTTLLAIAFLGVLAARWRRGVYDRRLVFMALLVVCPLFEYSFFTKNVRYAVLLELPLRVFAVCMLAEVFRARSPIRSTLLSGVAIACLCWSDARTFDLFWVRLHGYDPVTNSLLSVRHIIPDPRKRWTEQR